MEVKIVDLKQRHIEAFVKEMPVGKDALNLAIPLYQGMTVRAACKAGWFIEPLIKSEDVDDMPPSQVRELFTAVIEAYNAATAILPS
jgi:hypothetical protein